MILIYIFASAFAIMTIGFSIQFVKAWIMEIVYLWEKHHADKEDSWIYEI